MLLLYVQKFSCSACKWIWVCVRRAKCTGHTKKNQIACSKSNSSEYSAKSLQLKCCCKSEAQKRLSFVCNDNKAFRAKNKKWQTVDEVRDSRNVQIKARAEKMAFSKNINICLNMWTFFFWRKYPACYCALPEERSTNIPEHVHVYFSLQMM